jgi:hypothetical protein
VIVRFSKVIYIRDEFTMLRRSLFVSTVMLAGVVGFASSAKAVTEPVTLSGEVSTTCTLTNAVPGTISPNNAATTLSTNVGGTPAKIDIACDGGDLSVSAPSQTRGPTTTTFDTLKANITTTNGTKAYSAAADGPVTVPLTTAENGTANVNMTASVATGTIPAGIYEFTVNVTATP